METETIKASEAVVNPFSDICSRLLLQIAVVLFLAISSSYALYEDQIGKFDWKQEYMGVVKLGIAEPRGAVSRVLHVSTESSVVAAVHLDSGALLWRAVLEDEEEVDGLVGTERWVVGLCGSGRVLRSWDARTGVLHWEVRLGERLCPSPSLSLDRSKGKALVLHCGILFAISLGDGELLWETDIALVTSTWDRILVEPVGSDVSVLGGEEGKRVAVAAVDGASGRLRATDNKPAPWYSTNRCEPLVSALLCLDGEGKAQVVRAEGGRLDIAPGPPGIHLRIWALPKGYFGLSMGGSLSVYETGRVEPSLRLSVEATTVTAVEAGDKVYVGVVGKAGEDGRQPVSWHSLPDGKSVAASNWDLGPSVAPIKRLIPTLYNKGGELVPEGVLSCEDGLLTLPGDWERREALAEILAMEMADLPLSEGQANIEKEFAHDATEGVLSQMKQRLGMQYEQMGRSFRSLAADIAVWAHDTPAAALLESLGIPTHTGTLKPGSDGKKKLERDAFNLNKVIVLTTEVGKIFGLDSRDGGALWELWSSRLRPLQSSLGKAQLPVFLLRSTAHFPHPALALVVGSDKVTRKGLLVWLNPISGQLVSEEVLPWPIRHHILLPYTDSEAVAALAFIGPDNQVEVRPSGVEVPSPAVPIFYMRVETETGSLVGLELTHSASAGFKATQRWSNQLPLATAQRLITVAAKPFSERMHSPGRALGDRSVLYKYANPNLVAIAALSDPAPDTASAPSAVGGQVLVSIHVAERMHSPGRALGDRSVLYKYANPNLVAIAALSDPAPDTASAPSAVGGQVLVSIHVAERMHSPGRALGDRSVLYKYANPNLVAIAALSDPAPNTASAPSAVGGQVLVSIHVAERMHSPGRALGDRSVLYKYANPNLVAIAALSDPAPDTASAPSAVGGQVLVSIHVAERMHSPGRALGDRSVLYKYANPNLVAIAALSDPAPDTASAPSAVGGQVLVSIHVAERMHSPGRALGDRSVLYKYANPNLVAIAALSDPAPDTASAPSAVGGQLTLFLVDAVSGEVIHAVDHHRIRQPFHLLHCENWLVYSFWNEKARRTEVATLELYEGKEQADPARFSSLSPSKQKPLVLPQSYIFQQGITALGVTDTEKGMTNRHLLLAMPFGGILEMPKGLLDPRRSLTLTPENREEGLIPYIPELPIATEHILNYNQSLLRLHSVETRPGGLESTSLLLARGLDVYFTRLTPSGTFDVLKDDFDHWIIAAVLIALALATLISKRLARSRDLHQSWK